MTYYTEDPAYRAAEIAEAHHEFMDVFAPGWETRELDPERFVSEQDMMHAEIADADALAIDMSQWEGFHA